MWEGFRDTLRAIRSRTSAGLMMEQESELAIPYASSFWSRQFAVLDVTMWSARSAGIFSYLYHEYVTAIGAAEVQGQGSDSSHNPTVAVRCRAFANSLVRGLLSVPFLSQLDSWNATHPPGSFGANISECFYTYSHMESTFAPLLFTGEAVPPPYVMSDRINTTILRPSGVHRIELPGVIAGSFASNGSVGTVLASGTTSAQNATLLLGDALPRWLELGVSLEAVASAPNVSVALYRADGALVECWKTPLPALEIVFPSAYSTRMVIVGPDACRR